MFLLSSEKIMLVELILFLIFNKIYSDDCLTHSLPGINYPKSKTLENDYQLMVNTKGIYTFYPTLSSLANSYNFTDEQKFSTDLYNFNNTINQVEISQFTQDEGGKRYIICLAKNFLYFMNEKGAIIFIQELPNKININYSISLLAYKFLNSKYYFILAHNFINSSSIRLTQLYYYEVNKDEIEGKKLILEKQGQIQYDSNEILSVQGISCQAMNSSNNSKILICFNSLKKNNNHYIAAYSLNPENSFDYILKNSLFLADNGEVKCIKSSVSNNKKKALICYSIESPCKIKCIYYDINTNYFNETSLNFTYCNIKFFGFNINYFEKSNEYIFSCINNNLNKFYIIRIDENFKLISDNYIMNKNSFSNCHSYDFLSIIYISKYKHYSIMLNSVCDEGTHTRIFLLTSSTCISPSDEIEDNNEDDEEEKKQNLVSSLSDSTFTQILATISDIKTTAIDITVLKNIQTTIPKIIQTTIPKIIQTSFPKTISTLLYIKSSIISSITEKIDNFTTIIESVCNDNTKIYNEGKCICDINKGYYQINYEFLKGKCYKKNEIPKNLYFNDISQSYDLCYETCGTCNKGGNVSENNCLTCASNLIKEPEKNSSNCVENCRYLYYYNPLGIFSCTEDEQCPVESSLIIRAKNKCIDKCSNDGNNKYQYNGECLVYCPSGTVANKFNICQINNTSTCSISELKLNLNEAIDQSNVILVAKNYANEFYYTNNHISKFMGSNFKMILYKNSFCIDKLKLNITKIGFDSCIKQLKLDNNIDENKELIVAVIDIVKGDNTITSFGFFHPDNGNKLDASKSCSDKSVMMYENLLTLLNNSLAIQLLEEQKINIFDLSSDFYNDICFHYDSPNGKDATLQDRIKSFYPNITLCDPGCKNKGINLTSMEAECECTFQDLLSKNIFDNDLIGGNVLIKETVEEIIEMISNLNIEILLCYKDVFDYNYFKKNTAGFIVLFLFIIYTILIIYYNLISKKKIIRYIYSLTEKYILFSIRNNKFSLPKIKYKNIKMPPKRKIKSSKKIRNVSIVNTTDKSKSSFTDFKSLNLKTNTLGKGKTLKEPSIYIYNRKSNLKKSIKEFNLFNSKKKKKLIMSMKPDFRYINNDVDLNKFLEPAFEVMDYDDTVEEDKRTFCQYFKEKILDNQIIVNTLFMKEEIRPSSIKIAIFILIFDIYFLTNGLFYSDSIISEIYNSTEEESSLSFIPRSIDRFIYTTIIGKIIDYMIRLFFVEEMKIRKILLKKRDDILTLRYEMSEVLNTIFKRIKILIILNYIVLIFSWYYLSCFNNIYPHIRKEWIYSSLFIFAIIQILQFIFIFIEASIRFIGIKCESEKLFKLSQLIS